MCVDVVRTAGVGLLDTRGFSPVPELSFQLLYIVDKLVVFIVRGDVTWTEIII